MSTWPSRMRTRMVSPPGRSVIAMETTMKYMATVTTQVIR